MRLAGGRGSRVAEVSEGGYGVVVTREDGHWLADVPELTGAVREAAANSLATAARCA